MSNLENIREILGGPDDSGPRIPSWKSTEFIGQVEQFNGNQVHKVDIVGMGDTPDSIQLATHDTWDMKTRISRTLVMAYEQVPPILESLIEAEKRVVDVEATAAEAWPGLPLVLAEVEGLKGTVKVLVDQYKGRLEIKLAKDSRTKQWMKWQPTANRQVMKLILEAYDVIGATEGSGAPDHVLEEGDGIPF